MKNETHIRSRISRRASLLETLTRIAVVVFEVAIALAILRHGAFEHGTKVWVAKLPGRAHHAEASRGDPIRLGVGVPPPLLDTAAATAPAPEVAPWS